MIDYVQSYLDGEIERWEFDCDFNHTLIENYKKMERANPALADCFYVVVAEQGVDLTEHLSDVEHKKLIRRQFNEFIDIMKSGFY
jgi:hypothetical protein